MPGNNMPDNFSLYDAYERELAKWEERLPICDCCGCHVSEWYEVDYKGQTLRFCHECTKLNEFEY